ncbi:MAG TPA: EamA/RhaT family transporter, partial [Caulobacter sp.]|nr:EamA/RhaT family transporter [Caulobacter sp.]
MSLRDFGVLVLICLVWAGNNIISKIVVSHWGVPPLAYAA